jgi:hypothetical protein
VSHEPDGIVVGDEFADYMGDLRRTWPADDVLAEKHGLAAENGRSEITMSKTEFDSAEQSNQQIARRPFMIGAATFATVLATGTVSAQSGDPVPTFGEYTPDPWLAGDAEIAEHKGSWDLLDYQPNSGDPQSLSEHGGALARRPTEGEAHNPIMFRADRIITTEFTDFPRGVTRADGDGGTEDVSALDASEWTTSGTEISVTDDGDALNISTSGLSAGVSATATFDNVTISSGEPRKILQLVANLAALGTDGKIRIRVVDGAGTSTESVSDELS